MPELTRQELVERVIELRKCEWSKRESEVLIAEIEKDVPCPFAHVQEYAFHTDLTAEEVVEKMLAYKPIAL
ncbi:MAG: hypothetical protein JXR96_15985 [Deltaproteobacteria bacterium]|nr:hypothetical protein [Deltaproteobacteria bacterium]